MTVRTILKNLTLLLTILLVCFSCKKDEFLIVKRINITSQSNEILPTSSILRQIKDVDYFRPLINVDRDSTLKDMNVFETYFLSDYIIKSMTVDSMLKRSSTRYIVYMSFKKGIQKSNHLVSFKLDENTFKSTQYETMYKKFIDNNSGKNMLSIRLTETDSIKILATGRTGAATTTNEIPDDNNPILYPKNEALKK